MTRWTKEQVEAMKQAELEKAKTKAKPKPQSAKKGRPQKAEAVKRYQVTIDETDAAQVDAIAASDGRSTASVIREAVRRYLHNSW